MIPYMELGLKKNHKSSVTVPYMESWFHIWMLVPYMELVPYPLKHPRLIVFRIEKYIFHGLTSKFSATEGLTLGAHTVKSSQLISSFQVWTFFMKFWGRAGLKLGIKSIHKTNFWTYIHTYISVYSSWMKVLTIQYGTNNIILQDTITTVG